MSKKLYTSGEINAVFNSNINKNLFFNKVEIDSRQLSNRIIFFAIKGVNDDGHRYVRAVLKNKNNLAIISEKPNNLRSIRTKNTLEGLRNLASYARQRSNSKIIAITGRNFKNINGICKAKAEIMNGICQNGIIILNKDDKFFYSLKKIADHKNIKVLTFGYSKSDIQIIKKSAKVFFKIKNKIFKLKIKNFNKSFLYNVAATLCVHYYLNHNINLLKNNFNNFKIPEGRGNEKKIQIRNKKILLINDSYNSNPVSLNEAIYNFSSRKKNKCRKILIMGDMLELGKKSKYYHQQAAKILNKTNIDKVFCVGSEVRHTYQKLNHTKKGLLIKNISFLKENIFSILENNDILLVKSSNRIGLFNFFNKF